LGGQLWPRGYFCATVGAVTEDQIKQYIEGQSDDTDFLKVWDEPKRDDSELESDSSD
jgi:putative transposase